VFLSSCPENAIYVPRFKGRKKLSRVEAGKLQEKVQAGS